MVGVSQLLRFVLVGAIAGVIGLLLVLSLQARIELRTFQEEPIDNIHWNVTQLELDIVRLEGEAALANALPTRDLAELRKRFDLFYSRASNMNAGTMFATLNLSDIIEPISARLQGFLDRTTPLIDGPDTALRAALPVIEAEARALRQDFRAMAVRMVDEYAATADERRTGLTRLLQQIGWAALAFVALLGVLLGYVLHLNRRTQRQSAKVARVSSRLQATVSTALDGVIVAGMDGRVIDFNGAASRIFGYDRDEAIGQTLSQLIVPAKHIKAHEAGMARIAATGEKRVVDSGRMQITARRKSGEEFEAEMSIASNAGEDGMIFIAYLRDISQRLADENALRHARDEAVKAEAAKTNFLAVMSHEMRTPLNGVMAALEIAQRKVVDDHQRRFLDLAQASARQLLRHVSDVLDISKVEGGHMPLADEDFDVVALVRNLVEPMRPKAAQNGTVIDVQALTDVPVLRGDGFRLGQVVQNLMSNAIKFTDGGVISVEVEVQETAADSVTVEIRVTDSGIGIAEADLERVFQDFVMIDPSYGREAGGTGLGLAISRRLIEAMGGSIGVESELGEGSCFWLRLPLRRVVAADAAAVPVVPVDRPLAGLDLLVVEDNATNRIVLEEMLVALGHRVTLAADGTEGVRQARARRFDAVLMDISMPVMDGLTATRLIRADGLSRGSRILAVTAHSMPADLARFRAAGMDGCLTKPISGADLARVLQNGGGPPQTPAEDSLPLISTARQAELRAAMGADGLAKAIARYKADMAAIFARLEQGRDTALMQDLMALCHEAAGASATIGASQLHAHFATTENMRRPEDRPAVLDRINEAAVIWQQTVAVLG